MNSEIQETIAEIRAIINLLKPLLDKLEEHIRIVEKSNEKT